MVSKLFLVFYLAGKVGGSVGPLPYDMKECLARRLEPVSNLAAAQRNDLSFIHHGLRMKKGGLEVRLMCEEWSTRPPIDIVWEDRP